MAWECYAPALSHRLFEDKVGIGTRGCGSLLLNKRCSTLMETAVSADKGPEDEMC